MAVIPTLQALVRGNPLSAPLAKKCIWLYRPIETAEAVFARHDSIAPGTLGKFRNLLSLGEQSSPSFAAARVRSSPCGDFC